MAGGVMEGGLGILGVRFCQLFRCADCILRLATLIARS